MPSFVLNIQISPLPYHTLEQLHSKSLSSMATVRTSTPPPSPLARAENPPGRQWLVQGTDTGGQSDSTDIEDKPSPGIARAIETKFKRVLEMYDSLSLHSYQALLKADQLGQGRIKVQGCRID